jgi:hypothetical protein
MAAGQPRIILKFYDFAGGFDKEFIFHRGWNPVVRHAF